jgi:hypothetical protein
MPHKCLNLLMSHIKDPNITDDKDEWNLIHDWLITATYCNAKKKKKSSVVGIDIEGVTCDDDEVQEWISQRLDKTIGPCRKPATQAIPPPPMVQHTAFHHCICPPRVLALPRYWTSHRHSAKDIVVTIRGDAYGNKGYQGGAAIHEG